MQPVDPLYDSRKTTKVCELEDGAICEYDVCDTHRYGDYDSKLFKYIGKGRIHSVNGVLQGFIKFNYYFWVRR